MVDPNRKINLHHTEDSDDDDDDLADLNDEHVLMIKEFEEEFKDRFTEKDEEYKKYLERKTKPLIVVYPFDDHRSGGRGGYQGGNSYRYQNNRGGRNHYNPYNRNHQDNHRRNFNQQNRYQNHQQRPYDQENNKRFRRDE